jgi:glycosyltransferase involved in cell wall biosynthesis
VLNQTHTDWIVYLAENGSTDATGKIAAEYAAKDYRIVSKQNVVNNFWYFYIFIDEYLRKKLRQYPLFAMLDADDEYAPDFLEKSLAFIEREDLDIVACGNDFVDAQTGAVNGSRVLAGNLIIERDGFSEYFAAYHQFTRTVWAKVFRLSVLLKCDFSQAKSVMYGADTMFSMEAFRNASRVGILAESLHKYYVSPNSVSYKFDGKRIESDRVLHKTAYDFLISKTGAVSPRNNEFLLCVYMNALKDTLKVLLNADITQTEKLNGLQDMFLCDHARRLAAYARFGALLGNASVYTAQRKELFAGVVNWLLSLEEVPDEKVEDYCELGEFVSAACENADDWLFFKKLAVRFLLDQERVREALPKIEELAELLPDDEEIFQMRELTNEL